jgi:hypothetical protein
MISAAFLGLGFMGLGMREDGGARFVNGLAIFDRETQ